MEMGIDFFFFFSVVRVTMVTKVLITDLIVGEDEIVHVTLY